MRPRYWCLHYRWRRPEERSQHRGRRYILAAGLHTCSLRRPGRWRRYKLEGCRCWWVECKSGGCRSAPCRWGQSRSLGRHRFLVRYRPLRCRPPVRYRFQRQHKLPGRCRFRERSPRKFRELCRRRSSGPLLSQGTCQALPRNYSAWSSLGQCRLVPGPHRCLPDQMCRVPFPSYPAQCPPLRVRELLRVQGHPPVRARRQVRNYPLAQAYFRVREDLQPRVRCPAREYLRGPGYRSVRPLPPARGHRPAQMHRRVRSLLLFQFRLLWLLAQAALSPACLLMACRWSSSPNLFAATRPSVVFVALWGRVRHARSSK